jgi:hypothetical protein
MRKHTFNSCTALMKVTSLAASVPIGRPRRRRRLRRRRRAGASSARPAPRPCSAGLKAETVQVAAGGAEGRKKALRPCPACFLDASSTGARRRRSSRGEQQTSALFFSPPANWHR